MNDLDTLIESAAVEGQLEAGVSPAIVVSRSSLSPRALTVLSSKKSNDRGDRLTVWTEKEDLFLSSHIGILPEKDIADALGRTLIAVHIRWKRELRLTAPSKRKDIMTGNQIANGLGIDCKSVGLLIDRGILSGWDLPGGRRIRVVRRVTLLRFLTNPMNWVYFDPERIDTIPPSRSSKSYDRDFWAHARSLVMRRKQLWGDEWWRIGKVAEHLNVDSKVVNTAIREGRLPALDWGNWWMLKSVATAPGLKIQSWTGKGGLWPERTKVSQSAQAFIVLAKAVGLQQAEVGAMMGGWGEKRVHHINCMIRKYDLVKQIIESNGLDVVYDDLTKSAYASWSVHRDRFPHLARYMESQPDVTKFTKGQSRYFNRIIKNADMYEKRKEGARA